MGTGNDNAHDVATPVLLSVTLTLRSSVQLPVPVTDADAVKHTPNQALA